MSDHLPASVRQSFSAISDASEASAEPHEGSAAGAQPSHEDDPARAQEHSGVRQLNPTPTAVPVAVYAALDLMAHPVLSRPMVPLPRGVLTLIQIACGCTCTIDGLVAATGRDAESLRIAAVSYIWGVLWADDGDHYRALGLVPGAPAKEVAQHFLWFAKWVGREWGAPDLEKAFFEKVLKAWNALKNSAARREYDLSQRRVPVPVRPQRDRAADRSERRIPWPAQPSLPPPTRAQTGLWQYAAVGAAMIAVVAIATLNWIVLVFPPSSSAASAAKMPAAIEKRLSPGNG